jgi:hypothetical protein
VLLLCKHSPVTWQAMEALLGALALGDYNTMARALATIGACSEDVDYDAFGRDLQSFFTGLESLNSSLVVTADAAAALSGGGRSIDGIAASLEVDQAQVRAWVWRVCVCVCARACVCACLVSAHRHVKRAEGVGLLLCDSWREAQHPDAGNTPPRTHPTPLPPQNPPPPKHTHTHIR